MTVPGAAMLERMGKMLTRLVMAVVCVAAFASECGDALADAAARPPEVLYTKVVRGDQSPPIDVGRRNPQGQVERGTCVVSTGASVEVVTGSLTKEALVLTCLNDCTGKPNHQTHTACDVSCDVPCDSRHSFMLTPREIPPPDALGLNSPFARLGTISQENRNLARAAGDLSRAIAAQMNLESETSAMQRSLFESLEDAADWGDEFALNLDIDDPYWEPYPMRISVEHWNSAPCSYSRRGYGYVDVTLKLTPLVDVAVTTASGTEHHLVRGDPVSVGHYWYPYSKPLWQGDTVVACRCRPGGDRIGDRPHYRIGQTYSPFPTRPALEKIGIGAWDAPARGLGLEMGFMGHDMNQFRLRLSNTGPEEAEVFLTPGTRLIPDDPSVQDMVIVEPASLVCPAGATRTASLVVVADASDAKSVEKSVRLHCLEIQKKEPTDATRFEPAAPDDDRLVAVVNYFNKAQFRGVWDQARTWIYTDQADREEMNKRVLPAITQGQYLNGLFDVSEAGAFDYENEKFRKLMTPSILLGASATEDAKAWAVDLLARWSPKELAAFVKEYSAQFAGRLGPEAGEGEIQHYAGLAAHLCASSRDEVRQAGIAFLRENVPAAQREKLADAGALEGALNIALTEEGPIARQAAETIALYPGRRSGEHLKMIAVFGRTPEARHAAEAPGPN